MGIYWGYNKDDNKTFTSTLEPIIEEQSKIRSRDEAATKIQTWWRLKQKRIRAAKKIQTWWQDVLAYKQDYDRQNFSIANIQAAKKIQKWWRLTRQNQTQFSWSVLIFQNIKNMFSYTLPIINQGIIIITKFIF